MQHDTFVPEPPIMPLRDCAPEIQAMFGYKAPRRAAAPVTGVSSWRRTKREAAFRDTRRSPFAAPGQRSQQTATAVNRRSAPSDDGRSWPRTGRGRRQRISEHA